MLEFLIKRTDGEWFDLNASDYAESLRPNSYPSKVIAGWGDHRIEVLGCEVSFSYEDPGIQVSFENANINAETAKHIVAEILQNIESSSGQKRRIIEL